MIINGHEVLPAGTEFGLTIKVRKNSVITEDVLKRLLDIGKANGFGLWRGSGNRGSYFYKIKKLSD